MNSSPVCFGARDHQFGRFYVPTRGSLGAIKLVHLYGYVSCDTGCNSCWSYWGCGSGRVNVAITTSANHVLLPPSKFVTHYSKWSNIPSYSSLSRELILSVFSHPHSVGLRQELRLWYGEDLVGYTEGDNGGRVCCDVYALYIQ